MKANRGHVRFHAESFTRARAPSVPEGRCDLPVPRPLVDDFTADDRQVDRQLRQLVGRMLSSVITTLVIPVSTFFTITVAPGITAFV